MTIDEEHMAVLYVMAGLDLAIERGWMGGGPFSTEKGRELLDSWLAVNVPPSDDMMLSVLAHMVFSGKIDLGGGDLAGQKSVGVEDFLTLIKAAWEEK